jgi:L-cysteine desulfidase
MSDDYVKVKGSPNLVKNAAGVVLNIDKNGLEAAKRRKLLAQEQQKEKELMRELKSENEELRNDIKEMKDLLNSLIKSK